MPTTRRKGTAALAVLLASAACTGKPQSKAESASSSTDIGTIRVVDGQFAPEPSDEVATARAGSRAWLSVRSKHEWAQVELDGKDVGATPLGRVDVPAGHHTLVLRFAGGSTVPGEVDLQAGQHVRLTATPASVLERRNEAVGK